MSESAVFPATQTIHAHRALAEEGVQQFYACEGLPPPLTLWLRSPVEGAIVADLLASVKSHGPQARNSCLWDIYGNPNETGAHMDNEILLNEVRAQIWNRAWGMTAKEIGHQFDVSTQPTTLNQRSINPHHYHVWLNAVAGVDVVRFETAPAIALSNLEKTFLSNGRFPWEPDSRYVYGEVGRIITTRLDAIGNRLADYARPRRLPERAKSLYQIAKNCGWLWMFEGVCVLTDPPELLRVDDAGRLHCENGPALRYSDGIEIYAWHGVDVPSLVIFDPTQITLHMIKDSRNSEVRRVMIERYGGLARYAMDGGFTLVDELPADHPQVGLRTAKLWQGDDEDDFDEVAQPLHAMYVDLLNSTPEPDGTTKRYMLRVDPAAYGGDAARCVQAAAASTWRDTAGELIYSDWRDYAPSAES